jgi:hypothetical protein
VTTPRRIDATANSYPLDGTGGWTVGEVY